MIINRGNLSVLDTAFNAAFTKGEKAAESFWAKVAMKTESSAESETYGWLGQFPRLREWVGDRVVSSLTRQGYALRNLPFESTIEVPRTKIEDDQYGIFAPMFEEMGRAATEKPDELIFNLLRAGFVLPCYDGQYFFDNDHPAGQTTTNPLTGVAITKEVSVSNYQQGTGEPWFLLDTTRAIRPLIYQERIHAKLTKLDGEQDENVFWRDQYVYGVRARMNVGFGLWQLAYASKATLDMTSYEAARIAMQNMRGDEGRLLAVKPNVLVVSPNLEGAAREIVGNQLTANGGTNKWYGTAEVIVSPWLLG